MPERKALLISWLQESCGLNDFSIEPASGDASFRRYFRVFLPDGGTLVAMDAPPTHEDCHPFADVTERLAATGVHVPKVHGVDFEQGFMLLEDLGGELYLPSLNEASVDGLYRDAVSSLLKMQASADVSGLPPYDEALLSREMALFTDWLLDKHLGLALSEQEQQAVKVAFEALVVAALEQPKTFVHRDYHSRNLLITKENSPGIIDYQDAVHGPVIYDLVSLLKDCYIAWPLEQVDAWALTYLEQAKQVGLIASDVTATEFLRWFDLMGAQRHLKAAGIFARLNHRDGKPGYLADIPRTLSYILAVAERRPELAALSKIIGEKVMPRL